jgi:hypothetical protein
MAKQSTSTKTELLPCPFCCHDAIVFLDRWTHGYGVSCTHCHAANGGIWANAGKAVQEWNMRSLRPGTSMALVTKSNIDWKCRGDVKAEPDIEGEPVYIQVGGRPLNDVIEELVDHIHEHCMTGDRVMISFHRLQETPNG